MRMDFSKQDMLVSVIVITYNSAATVLETLESIRQQTYENIELVISDDCSKDHTVAVCREWLDKNIQRFVRAELITVGQNTGVCANLNRAIAVTRGEWIKEIAGDDILLSNCIADFVGFVKDQPKVMWVSSQIRKYYNTFNEENCFVRNHVMERPFFDMDANGQLRIMARRDVVYAPAMFIKKEMLDLVGGYNESLSFEDYSFCMDALELGQKCYLMEKETACYRIHGSSCRSREVLFNYKFLLSVRPFYTERCFKYLSGWQILGIKLQWRVEDLFVRFGLNTNKHKINAYLYKKISGAIFHIFR